MIVILEPKERWPTRLGVKCLKVFLTSEWLMKRYRAKFVPSCNELLKDRDTANRWYDAGKTPELHMQDLTAHAAVTRGLRSAIDSLPKEVGQALEYGLDLQDARLYHLALRAYAHCALSKAVLNKEEHAIILDEINATEEKLARVQERSTASISSE